MALSDLIAVIASTDFMKTTVSNQRQGIKNPLPSPCDEERVDSCVPGTAPYVPTVPKGHGILICGILYPDPTWLHWAMDMLTGIWGNPQRTLSGIPFDATPYYQDIAPELKRAFVSFPDLKLTDRLPEWKHTTCALEKLSGSQRRVNLDPGYVDGARVVLASTKDHSHRIYMGHGIFAEVTLRYNRGKWLNYSHTFPDFKSGQYDRFLSLVRNDWRSAIREEAPH